RHVGACGCGGWPARCRQRTRETYAQCMQARVAVAPATAPAARRRRCSGYDHAARCQPACRLAPAPQVPPRPMRAAPAATSIQDMPMRLLPTMLTAALAAALAACAPAADADATAAGSATPDAPDAAPAETSMTSFETVGQLTSF